MTASDRIISIFETTLNIEPSRITDDLAYNSINEWDSVAHFMLILALEEAFGIQIGPDDVVEMTTVRRIKAFLEKNTKNLSRS